MFIGIGSKNRPKINACTNVINALSKRLNLDSETQIIARDVSSGIAAMPLSISEMMLGARNRAIHVHKQLKTEGIIPHFAIGLEGGIFLDGLPDSQQPIVFLQSWVCVYDGSQESWGSSGAINLPEHIARPLLNKRAELAQVIDRIADQKNIRSGIGAIGVLTDKLVVREQFFEQALQYAFAPFYNQTLYQNI